MVSGAGMGALHLREVLRNPWTLLSGLALVGIALAFRDRGSAVGLVSLVAVLQVFLPPLTVVVAAPLLTRRETWAFWSALPRPPAGAFRGAVTGIAVGLLLPLLAGAAVAGLVLGLAPFELLLLCLAVAAILALWSGLVAAFSALTLDATRAMAISLAAWAVLVLAYGPAVVSIAVALADYPLANFLIASLLLNPFELLRVGLLQSLEVPVLVGPVGRLVGELLPAGALALSFAVAAVSTALLVWLAGWLFARRDR